ncbi:MAG: hypothetical protein AAF936_09030 [Pseudomonadota bacterium]
MNQVDEQKRKDAIRGLINIALFEGVFLAAVIGVYFYTNNIVHLVGGVIGSTVIFGPMFLRWFREYGEAMKAKPNSAEDGR